MLHLRPGDHLGVQVEVIGDHARRAEPGLRHFTAVRSVQIERLEQAFARSSGASRMKPVRPSSTISGTEPADVATTGVPQARASIITKPNGSDHWIGFSNAVAAPSSSNLPASSSSPTYSTPSPSSGSTLVSKYSNSASSRIFAAIFNGTPAIRADLDGFARTFVRRHPAQESDVAAVTGTHRDVVDIQTVVDDPADMDAFGCRCLVTRDSDDGGVVLHALEEQIRSRLERTVVRGDNRNWLGGGGTGARRSCDRE